MRSVPNRRCTNSGFSGHIFLSVCDRTRESNDSCSLRANGKISTPPILPVFISALGKCFRSLCESGEGTTCDFFVFLPTGEIPSRRQGLQHSGNGTSTEHCSAIGSQQFDNVTAFYFFNLCTCMLKLSHPSTSREDPSETQQTSFKRCPPPLTVEFPLRHF